MLFKNYCLKLFEIKWFDYLLFVGMFIRYLILTE